MESQTGNSCSQSQEGTASSSTVASHSQIYMVTQQQQQQHSRIGLGISAEPITFSACSPLEFQESPVVDRRNKNNKSQKCTCKGQCTENRYGCRKSGNICTAKYICRGKCSKWNPNSSWRYAMSFNTSSSSELFLCNSKSSSFAATWKSWKSTSILLIWGELKKLLVLLHVLPVVKIDSLQNLLKEERSVASALGCSLWSTFKKICQGACWRPSWHWKPVS